MSLLDFSSRYPKLVARLGQARCNERIAHSYLFSGDNAEVLEGFARAWLRACACMHPTDAGDACGGCVNCRDIEAGRYPYLQEVRPLSKSRRIRVGDIRQLEHYIHLTSGVRLKIGVIHDADRMNVEAQNAFLKTLEEPSPGTLLLLLTCHPAAMLDTIRSRCQSISLLDNRVEYDFPQMNAFYALLLRLQPRRGASEALNAAEEITSILSDMRTDADEEGAEFLAARHIDNPDMDKQLKKRLDEEAKAVSASVYLGRRDKLLSALHTWFGREFVRAHGVALELLPNPEMHDRAPAEVTAAPASVEDAERCLKLTEELAMQLNFNVDEKLAINDYCQQLCRKN